MSFEQVRLRTTSKDKLKLLSDLESRSMANYLEVLIDTAFRKSTLKLPQDKPREKELKK